MAKFTKQEALDYHSNGRPGKVEVVPTKPYNTQRDLSLAYSPGVAEPCLEIEAKPETVNKYTAKGNLVAVISNGTAVLGLGDIGAEAGKPVMEGKGLLFKIFADVDVFDIEIETKDVDKFVETVKQISPTFGGINLEDIKAPECFEIERRLKEELDMPVMHDDQHGTAIISAAGLLNALEITGKKIDEIKVAVSGAGASASACTDLYISLGVKPENVLMCDSKGVLSFNRTDLNEDKKKFARETDAVDLADAVRGSDVFLGLSVKGALSKEMLASMNPNPIVFAMANPDPEISYDDAMDTRDDFIFATGRSDYPNQINNVLGFPFIFRGALDVNATAINEEMKIGAVKAIAALAKESVPESVNIAYNETNLTFGKDYIVPKPLDPRLITWVAPAVAKAAMESGVARTEIKDWDKYKYELSKRLGLDNTIMHNMTVQAQKNPKRVVFADATNFKVIKAAIEVKNNGIATPILLGNKIIIEDICKEYCLDIEDIEIIDIRSHSGKVLRKKYAKILEKKRHRRGVSADDAYELMFNRTYFGVAMVEAGDADALISGVTTKYAETIKPALQIIGKEDDTNIIAGMYLMNTKKGPFFFADTTVNINPDAETLVDITRLVSKEIKKFSVDPVMAMVSYSNFGSSDAKTARKVAKAVATMHDKYPTICVDGEMQANFALNTELRNQRFPFSKLKDKDVNTLIFPTLSAGNIAYKMMQEIGASEAIGPILLGLKKSVHVLQLDSSVKEIVDMVTIAVVDAQKNK